MTDMATTSTQETLDRLLNPISECLTKEVAAKISGVRADPVVQEQLDLLAEKNAEGRLTDDERAQYELLIPAGNLIAVLQAKARVVMRDAG
jgi:hypothetical protein